MVRHDEDIRRAFESRLLDGRQHLADVLVDALQSRHGLGALWAGSVFRHVKRLEVHQQKIGLVTLQKVDRQAGTVDVGIRAGNVFLQHNFARNRGETSIFVL